MMDYLISKYFNNQISREEKEILFHWIDADPANEKYFIDQKKIHSLWKRTPRSGKEAVWKEIRRKTIRPRKIQRHLSHILRYAAILIISLLVYKYIDFSYRSDKLPLFHSFFVAEGQIDHVTLCDGSVVWLNSGSELRIPSDFSSDNRMIQINGQGFFEVQHDPGSPFIVNTHKAKIRVLGTRFDVNTYNADYLETTLIEGKIQVYYKDQLISELKPGDQLSFNYQEESTELVRLYNTEFYSSWSTGKMKFEKVALRSILEILGKWHKIEFQIEQEELGEIEFSGTLLKDDELDKSLHLFTSASDLIFEELKISGKKVIKISR